MGIADTRVHIWGPDTPQHPWAPKGAKQAHRPKPLGKDERIGEEELDFLADEDKGWIMGRGMAEWLGWSLPYD
jgi:dihydrofolate reductase